MLSSRWMSNPSFSVLLSFSVIFHETTDKFQKKIKNDLVNVYMKYIVSVSYF